MDNKRTTQISKFLSLVLRHEPGKIGIALDPAGWVGVHDLMEALAQHGFRVSEPELQEVVATNDKKRFAFSDDGLRIRASQGHSVDVDLGYQSRTPPEILYHGTPERFLDSIRRLGLLKGERQHVHLSSEAATAEKVGERRGHPAILTIRAGQMHRDGLSFFVSANNVWLTEHVPVKYIDIPNEIRP